MAAVLGLFYTYVLLRIHPALFFYQDPVVFVLDSRRFAGFMERPGGPVEYVSAFLSALFVYGWLGALVMTGLAALICLAARRFLAAVAGEGTTGLFLAPAVLIVLLLGQYSHPVRLCVGLALVLGFANAYVWIGDRSSATRLLAFGAVSPLVYFLAAGFYVVFACLCAVFEVGVKRNRPLGLLCLLAAEALPVAVGMWLMGMNIQEAFGGLWLPAARDWLAVPRSKLTVMAIRMGLLLFLPIAAGTLLWRQRAGRAADSGSPRGAQPLGLRAALGSGAVLLAALAADLAMFDFRTHCQLEIAAGAENGRWADALGSARTLCSRSPKSFDLRVMPDMNRALYFHGRLLDDLFTYPQVLGVPVLAVVSNSATTTAQLTPRQTSGLLFELGRVNESEHMAYEALEIRGEQPQILKRLVYLHVLKGEPEAARRYLSLLECSLMNRGWARRCRRQLDADPTLAAVPEVALCRQRMVRDDSVNDVEDLERMLQGLLERNPRNRMAVEYLLAHYLLTRQLDKLAANLDRLDAFGDGRLPRHCEEGLLVHMAQSGSRSLGAWEGRISRATCQRFDRFMSVKGQFQYPAAAYTALRDDFGDTYWFAYTFGQNNPAAN